MGTLVTMMGTLVTMMETLGTTGTLETLGTYKAEEIQN